MSTVTALFLILLWQTSFLHNEAALVVFAPSPQRAQLGENMVLPCSFRVDDNPINLQYLAILWLFQGNEILRFDNKGELSQPRMFINKQDITKGIANMEIKNVTISDIGKYRCMVIYSPQKESRDIDLSVYATPSVVIEQVEKEDKMNIALCSVTGFYPRDITVEMLQDRTIIKDSVLSEYHTNADSTYSVNRTWKIPTDVSPKILSCSVHHETLTTPVQKDLQLVYQGNNDNTGVVVGCIVGMIIILILVAVLFIWCCKRKSDHQKFVMKDIECPIWSDGEKTTLSCEAFNCTGDVTMTWVIKFKDGTQHKVSDTGSNDNEEDQPLMSREYQVTKEYDNMKGHVTTKLTFIPSISRHLGSAVSCRIVHQKKPVEKTLEVKTIHAKPKFIEPVQFTLSDQEKVQISVKLQRFYPQEMEVTWFSKRGQSEEEIPEVMNNNHNSGDTFDLDSKCTVPGELFKDPTYKVIVRWKHESMEEPQSREISARDLPWHPKLQKFPIESIFQGDKVLLQCRVSDYFPNSLAVKWLERKMGSQELVEISSSQKYKIPEISSYRMENKTISSTAVLSYKRFDLSEKGVEFICKVEHPTLDTPIQTSIVQYRDTEAPTFILNNIQGPQIWFSGEKITLYCAASYCMEGTQVIWMVKAGVTISEIGEDEADVKSGSHQSSGYVAHREITEVSDKEGLQDVTSSLTFTPSISKHQNISITCRILCDGKVKEKTFQRQYLYAKPSAPGPIKLSLTDCGEVLCLLDIEGFYPSDIQMKWNDKETSQPNRTSQNNDGTYSVHSEYKVPGSFFSDPGSAVRVSWKHGSMEDWESREMCVRDTEFPWKPDIQDIAVPNLLIGSMATLKCKISNVFPDALSVKWLKKEKGGQELFPVINSQTYNISDLRLEKQKDNTFIYTNCLMFEPSINREEGVEFICRVEHPTLAEPAEKSTGPLTIQGKKVAASISQDKHQDSSSQITPEVSVDGSVPPIPPTAGLPFTSTMKNGELETRNTVSNPSLERPTEKISGPLPRQAKPKGSKLIKALLGTEEVIFSYRLENFYPKDVVMEWHCWSGGNLAQHCSSKDVFKTNLNKTFSVTSECKVPENFLPHPEFRVRFTWRHVSMEEEEYKEFSIRDKDFPWRPHVEMSVPPLKSSEEATIQCTVTKYFPNAGNLIWLRKDSQSREVYLGSSDGMYKTTNTLLERQKDKTYGCRSCVTFYPSLERDQGVEFICRVQHPSLEQPMERSTGALQVTAPEQQEPYLQHPQDHSGVTAPESHHPSPQDLHIIMGHQHQTGVPESPHSPLQDVYNMGGQPMIPTPQQPCSPHLQDGVEEMDVESNFSHQNFSELALGSQESDMED